MTKRNKLMGIVIAILILMSNISIAFAQTTDYSKNWANKEIEKWLSFGVIQTNDKGDFKPSDPIKRIDMAIILNRLFNYQEKSGTKFSDIAVGSPYAADVAKAVAAGNFAGNNGKFRPNDYITRQEAAVVFARAFSLTATTKNSLVKFKDATKIATWSKDAVNIMVNSGYMNGIPGNLFAPDASITRAEAIKIVDNMAKDLKNKAGTYTGDVNGNIVVNTKDVILENMTIKGDLYLSEGIGNGEVKLNNVKISGNTVVKGGGENSIVLNNTSISGSLVIIKKDGKVRVVASGSSGIGNIVLNSGAKLEESNLTGNGFGDVDIIQLAPGQQITLDGDFESLDIEADGVKANIPDGSIGTVKIKKGTSGSKLEIGNTASVKNLVANDDVAVTGGSRIGNADINSNGVVIDTKPGNIEIAPNVTATVAGTSTTGTSTTPTTPSAAVIPPVVPPVSPPAGGGNPGDGGNPGGGVTTPTITVSAIDKVILLGTTTSSAVTTSPVNAVLSFSSNKPSVVSVNAVSGVLTGASTGSAVITVTASKAGYNNGIATFKADVGVQTPAGSVSVYPQSAIIGGTSLVITISFTPAVKTKNQTVIFNLPDEIKADTKDKYSISPGVLTTLSAVQISNSGKTITLKNLDLTNESCKINLFSKTMPTILKALSFTVSSDCDGDLNGSLPSTDVSAALNLVSTISDLSCGINDRSIHAMWTPPVGASLVVISYKSSSGGWNQIQLPRGLLYYGYDINGLQPDTTYDVKLLVVGGINAGESNTVTIRTQKKPPTLSVSSLSNTAGNDITLTFPDDPSWRTNVRYLDVFYLGDMTYHSYVITDPNPLFSIIAGSITIKKEVFSHTGDYSIYISGTASYSPTGVILHFGPINDFYCSGMSTNSITTFGFRAPAGANSIKIQQSADNGGSWTESTLGSAITPDSTTAGCINLSANTKYKFRLVVEGGICAGNSNEVEYTTLSNIRDFSSLTCSSTTAAFSFSSPGIGITSAVVQISPDRGLNWRNASGQTSITANTTSTSISGLSPDTNYICRLLFAGGANAGYSNTVAFTTEGNIQDLTAVNNNDNSVTLQFSPLGGSVTSATIEYYSDINMKMYYEIPSINAATTSSSITNLAPDMDYTFRLLVNGGPNTGYSNTATIRTLPNLPISLTASDRTVLVGEVETPSLAITNNSYPIFYSLKFSSSNASVARIDVSSGIISGVSTGSAIITVTASNPGYNSVSKTFTVTVVEDSAPTIKASVDNRNNITLAFGNAVYKAGVMRVYTENGTTQLGISIDLTPAAGMAVWESPTVAKIVNTAGSTGLDNTDAKVIKVKITGIKEAVGSENTLAEKIITLQAMDTKAPQAAAYYVAKSGSTVANDTITFYFSEVMNANTLKDLNNYVVTSSAGVYYENKALSDYKDDVSISSVASDNKSVVIKINNGMVSANAGLAFQVHSMEDMAGNKIAATDVTRYIEVKPYVTTTRAIAVNKVEIEFNQEIAMCAPGTFILRTGPSSTSPVAAAFISASIDGKKVTATLDRNLTTDFSNAYLDVLNSSLTKNMYGVELTTAAGIYADAPVSLLAAGPVAVPDKVKPVVKAFSATTGGIIIEFSELMTTVATDFLIEMSLYKETDPVNAEATSISAIDGGNLDAGFTKLLVSGLEANKDYTIQLYPKGITRDKSEYCNMFVQSDCVTITPK